MGTHIFTKALIVASTALWVGVCMAADHMSVVTGPSGGSYYAMGGVWAQVAGKKAGFDITPEVGKAGKGNVILVNSGKADFGITGDAISYEGYAGIGWAKDKKYANIRSVLPMANGYIQLWSRRDKASVKTVKDLAGRRLGLAAPGGVIDVWGRRILDFFKIKGYRVVNASHSQLGSMLADDLIDVHGTFSSAPHPAVIEEGSRFPLTFLSFSDSEIESFTKAFPWIASGEIPARTYQNQQSPIKTFVSYDSLITSKNVKPEVVYELVKSTFENKSSLEELNKAINAISEENLSKLAVPYHLGAIRYFREKGIQIPEKLIPPEAK